MHLQVEEPKAFGSYVHLDLKKVYFFSKIKIKSYFEFEPPWSWHDQIWASA